MIALRYAVLIVALFSATIIARNIPDAGKSPEVELSQPEGSLQRQRVARGVGAVAAGVVGTGAAVVGVVDSYNNDGFAKKAADWLGTAFIDVAKAHQEFGEKGIFGIVQESRDRQAEEERRRAADEERARQQQQPSQTECHWGDWCVN
ncbi:uncharacterized protein LOC129750622 [Uranotaenia lowii]|uniref:uncharacterized protein LOC129750622 n=1 Tax=Uranotaenia lowii TaxID=190385 RepID=UPI002479F158|nr:uncharacterized protein LOC129750622 [Uranotaenia lowii]